VQRHRRPAGKLGHEVAAVHVVTQRAHLRFVFVCLNRGGGEGESSQHAARNETLARQPYLGQGRNTDGRSQKAVDNDISVTANGTRNVTPWPMTLVSTSGCGAPTQLQTTTKKPQRTDEWET